MALKPFCSGGREDARILRKAMGASVALDEINPWHFRAPLAPLVAARKEGRSISLSSALKFVRSAGAERDHLIIEGAGGLLSPLGDGFNALDLMKELRCRPVIVCPNRLGAINQILLVQSALTTGLRRRAVWVLMAGPRETMVTRTNSLLIRELLGPDRFVELPRKQDPEKWYGQPDKLPGHVRRKLMRIVTPKSAQKV